MSRRIRSVAVATAALLALSTAAVSAAPPTDRPSPPTAQAAADIQPRDLVIDQRGLGYLRRADGELVPYGHSIAAEKRPVEPRAPGGRPGRPSGDSSTDPGTVAFGQWEGGQVTKSAGRILFEMSDRWYVCSGTAVTDDASDRSIVLTAAHCIYDDVDKAFATQALFIPNQDDGGIDSTDADCRNDPEGCWILDHGVVDENWTTRTFPDNIAWDYGFYVVSNVDAWSTSDNYASPSSKALDDTVGTLSMDLNSATLEQDAHALGYSYDVDPEFMYCMEPLATETTYGSYWLGQCGMSGGASGGPWVQPMNDSTGAGPAFSVNSWGYSFGPGMGGPVLAGSSAIDLFTAAQASTLGSTGEMVGSDPATEPEPDTPTDVTLTGSSVDNGRTWQATVTVTGPAGLYSGSWSTGASGDTCQIDTGGGSCDFSTSQRKNIASVTFTLNGDSGQSETVAKP